MMNGQQYKESLKKLKPVIYCNGRKIESVVNDKMTAPHVNSAAMTYELAFQPEYEDLMTAVSSFTGKKINRFTHVHQSTDDLIKKVKMMRMIGQKTGTCYQRCVGFDAMNACFITTYKIDKKYGTDYHQRFIKYMTYVQDSDIMIAGSMTDPKGDRSKKPSQQFDPDLFVHIVEKREDGIVVRGAKAHQTGMVNSHEMLILPTTNLTPEDKDYAVAAAIVMGQKEWQKKECGKNIKKAGNAGIARDCKKKQKRIVILYGREKKGKQERKEEVKKMREIF